MNESASRRGIPQSLRAQAASRTGGSVETLRACMEAWERELREANFSYPHQLSLKELVARARLNTKFLYGPRHKDTTRLEAERWIRRMNDEREKHVATAEAETPLATAKRDAEYWKLRYERLARHANLWFARMRDQERQLRELRGRCEEDKGTILPVRR